MGIIVAGTESSIFRSVGHLKSAGSIAAIARTVNAAHLSLNYGRHGLQPTGALAQGRLVLQFPAQTDFWFHAIVSHQTTSNSSTYPPFAMYDSATGQVVVQYEIDSGAGDYNDGNADYDIEYWDGAAFQECTRRLGNTAAHSFRIAANTMYALDVHIKIANSPDGLINGYVDGVLRWVFSGDLLNTGYTGIDTIVFRNQGTSGTSTSITFSEVIVSTDDTRGLRVATSYPTANGTNTAWTNDYVSADKDSPALSDTSFIYSGSNGQVETYGMADLSTVADNLVPHAVVTVARAHVGASGPQNLQHVIRSGAADYVSSNVTLLDGQALADAEPMGPTVVVWTADPAGGDWTVADVNGMEVGVKSIT